jgi:Domain of unknown function (DUF4416)
MGSRKNPPKAKLILALLLKRPEDFSDLELRLQQRFGPVDVRGEPQVFTSTSFYAKELGATHYRAFLAFRDLVPRESLGPIKVFTNQMEGLAAAPGIPGEGAAKHRNFNLDPGLVTLGQLFLASTKDQRQRVYVGDGIYVEPTLYYQDKGWKTFPWTYPSYASGDYFDFLTRARQALAVQIKEQGLNAEPIAEF